jgi:hypothetical protein
MQYVISNTPSLWSHPIPLSENMNSPIEFVSKEIMYTEISPSPRDDDFDTPPFYVVCLIAPYKHYSF